MNGWMDGWIDGWINEWMDGWMDGYLKVGVHGSHVIVEEADVGEFLTACHYPRRVCRSMR